MPWGWFLDCILQCESCLVCVALLGRGFTSTRERRIESRTFKAGERKIQTCQSILQHQPNNIANHKSIPKIGKQSFAMPDYRPNHLNTIRLHHYLPTRAMTSTIKQGSLIGTPMTSLRQSRSGSNRQVTISLACFVVSLFVVHL